MKQTFLKLVFLFILVVTIISCGKKQQSITAENTELGDKYGAYLSSYTPSDISVSDKLIFRFAKEVVAQSDVNTIVNENLYKIFPKVKGDAKWTDRYTMVFTPEESLEFGGVYDFTLELAKILPDVTSDKNKVRISYNTKDLELKIVFDKLQYPANTKEKLNQTGSIRTSDVVPNSEVEKMLAAKFGKSALPIEWNHSSSTYHEFDIKDIVRTESKSVVSIDWNDKKYGTGFKGNWKQNIVPLGIFKVTNTQISSNEGRSIKLSFSNSLDKRQSLDGLIRIKDYTGKYKYDIIGSQVTVYPSQNVKSPFEIIVEKGIRNIDGTEMKESYKSTYSFDPVKPMVRLAGKGVIVPFNDEIIFPFEAVNLKGATVEVFKIFNDNVLQFLQYNRLNTTYSLQPVGRIVHQEEIDLSTFNIENNEVNFKRYALDLRKMITPDPGALYQIRIGFNKGDVINYPCKEESIESVVLAERDGFQSIMSSGNRYDGYRWEHREDPCKKGFYNQSRFISRNVLASNIGIIAKRDKNKTVSLTLSDLKTVDPISGALVTFYDFQQQEISTANSGSDGQVTTQLEKNPAFAIIKDAAEFGYINLQDQHANSLSEFQVSGKTKKKGLDGYIYGERGVWRPGDTLFLNFVLEDKLGKLPAKHPVTLVVKDSRGKKKYNKTTNNHLDHVYDFPVTTDAGDPTGNWTATVKVGGATFQKSLKVETVKPNRLKINYDLVEGEALDLHGDQNISLTSKWLHGAPADGLRAKVDLQIRASKTQFPNYMTYSFDDPARKIEPTPMTVFDGNLSESGTMDFNIDQKENWLVPGRLVANFKTKIFEKGGNFSEDNFSVPADLYSSYVGVKIPTTRWGSKFIKENTPTDIPIVVLDTDGKPIANRNLSIGIYQARWNWWYDRGYSDKYNYNSAQHNGAIIKEKVKTDSKGNAKYRAEFEDYGNYMIRICDDVSGHCTGDMFYTGYSWSSRGTQEGPQQLIFQTDKKSYISGDLIEVKIPSNEGSKIFISIENGEKVLQSFWVEGMANETEIVIPTDPSMNSNVYIHAHLIQPHNNGENDLPMRMFGVVPVSVIDPASQLTPEIKMAESIRPNESFTVKVEEKYGKRMTYTLAVVDEGLLDLTRYKTPDAWNHFYSKQALGVKTWDIYDMVLDGYGGALDQYISIGGDANGINNKKGKKANRFVPVVRHIGPFTLEVGEQNTHVLDMPNYVGSVRTMVVARNGDAYGSTEKTATVKKPLMVLSTLPRVLGPNETLSLPTNVFAMEDKIKNVSVSVETSDNVSISGSSKKNLAFAKIGDQQAYFDMKVGDVTGPANIKVRVQGHGEGAFEEVNIDIRNPNPFTSEVYEAVIEPGESWEMDYKTFGTEGSNEAFIELSSLPSLNFNKRLRYLIKYPYGCVEQTTSSVFPQLYINEVTDLSPRKMAKIESNIRAGINRLTRFQTSGGGLAYWQGGTEVSEWGTNYAGHFLIEAKDKGYFVPDNVYKALIKYQDQKATSADISNTSNSKWKVKMQAYRLYMLAKAGSPNIGAMNRLRKSNDLDQTSAHMLAASYGLIGKKDIASALVANLDGKIEDYMETGYTYGSTLRDLSIIAETQLLMGNQKEAALMIKKVIDQVNQNRWYSTQTTAYALLSIGKFLAANKSDELSYEYTSNREDTQSGNTNKPTVQKALEMINNGVNSMKIKNTSGGIMYSKLVVSGQLPPGTKERAYDKHVKLSVTYVDNDGKKLDPKMIKQGTDFIAKVSVRNLGSRGSQIKEMALSQIFPSGWEIQNDRMSSISGTNNNSTYDYRDVRDDRVYTFFDMNGRSSVVNYSVNLTAAYAGRFYLSPVYVEAMYDNEIQAKNEGMWVEVKK